MWRKSALAVVVISLLGLAGPARSDTIFHWQFDGTFGEELISDTDIVGSAVAVKFDDGEGPAPDYDVKYGEANPLFNTSGTSADFLNNPSDNDPGVGLFVNDQGVDTALDLSTLGAFTIEAFIHPYTLRQSVVVRKYGGSPGQYYIDLRSDGDLQFSINNDDNAAVAGAGVIQADTWHHVAAVFDESDGAAPMKIYVDGILKGTATHSTRVGDSPRSFGIGCIVRDNSNPPGNSGQFFNGRIDEVRISDKALGPSGFLHAGFANLASNPSPVNWGAIFDTEATLTWTPGENAARHDVYFGTDFNDVNTAGDPNVSPGRGRQDSNTYDVCDLELAQTYYWRIDEVNGPCTWRGNVWRFAVVDGFVNSIGMELVRLLPGTFSMGSDSGDQDEEPVHQVTISNSFYMSVTEVTNAQYELFDPCHSAYRAPQTYNGQTVNMSTGDNEAVIYMSWQDANNFCQWLSNLEGQPYRLPTEAEWEYACRAGTTSPYYTGDSLPSSYYKNQENSSWPDDVDLTVKTTGQNSWGLWDMHGNVEEWCYDWYGPYESGSQADPVGRASGDFRVSRGGSHNTPVYYLRSANRLSSLPKDKNWLIGFRVVCGEMPDTPALPEPAPKLWSTGVSQTKYNWPSEYETPTTYFIGPQVWVREPSWADEIPMYGHNHQPGVTFCDNGDLFGAWYSCNSEKGRELTVLAGRLRQGNSTWDYPAEFFKAQDRNMHGTALLNDRNGKLYLFNGLGTDYSWEKLALCAATSTDNGVTWQPRLINPNHGKHHQVVAGPIKTRQGYIIVAGDANPGSAIHISRDNGQTFVDPGENRPEPDFEDGGTGAWIAGIHCGFVQLLNGNLLAFGRGDNINDMMPRSNSSDMGENWTYSASLFQPISGGQRCVLLRLDYSYGERLGETVDSPILMLSFGSGTMLNGEHQPEECSGMFAAISYDDGQTWTDKKLISNLQGSDFLDLDGGGNTGWFTMTRTQAEPKGYLSATQTPDGIVHVCSSRLYYAFNLVWIDQDFTPLSPLLKADLYEDGVIKWDDLRILVQQWLDDCPAYEWCGGRDINRDGSVDFLDFTFLASYWLESWP